MRSRLIHIAMLSLLLVPVCYAQNADDAPAAAPTSKQPPKPDFSKPSLLRLFVEAGPKDDDNAPRDPFDYGIVYQKGSTRFRWLPFVAPFFLGATMPWAHVSSTSSLTVDPFALNHNVMAYTSSSFRDPVADWKFRRMLRKNAKEARKLRGDG